MKSKTIKQVIRINAPCKRVYEVFMDTKQHAEFTGFEAMIETHEGGFFKTCGNRNWGYNLHLEPCRRIIQAWRQIGFPDNRYSIIDLRFEETGEGETKLHFYQFGVPEDCLGWLKAGWEETYWQPLKRFLEKGVSQPIKP